MYHRWDIRSAHFFLPARKHFPWVAKRKRERERESNTFDVVFPSHLDSTFTSTCTYMREMKAVAVAAAPEMMLFFYLVPGKEQS